MDKIFKRLLSVILALVLVITLVPLSKPITVKAAGMNAGTVIYFDPSNTSWSTGGSAYGFVSTANNSNAELVVMQQVEGTNLYKGTLQAYATHINFRRLNANNTAVTYNTQSSWPVLEDGKCLYALNSCDETNWNNVTGTWKDYTPPTLDSMKVSDDQLFYVDTDLVDYYNDARVDYGMTGTFDLDNQGSWMGNFVENNNGTAFSYLNGKISSYFGNNTNSKNIPLYFGSLLFVNNRVGRASLKASSYDSLNKWNTTANVALTLKNQSNSDVEKAEHNTTAPVQGLVYDTLGANGQLLAPDGNTEMPYFSKRLADANDWKYDNKALMQYYEGYQFPFKVNNIKDSSVKKYSYDSATDYAVRLSTDSSDKKLVALNTNYKTKNNDKTNGYYPFNTVGESNRNNVNYGFGTKFTIPFTVNKNGTINGEEEGEAITFSFTGDDDVWVFLDGHLILDMGGAHGKAEGTINFKDLTATVKNAAQVSTNFKQVISGNSNVVASYNNVGLENYVWPDSENSGKAAQERSKVATEDSTKSFAELVNADFAKSFEDSSKAHTLVMFYMERGMFDSNMKVEFTINPLPSGLSLSKTLDTDNVNSGLVDAVKEAESDNFKFKIQTKAVGSSGEYSDVGNLGYTLNNYNNVDDSGKVATNSVISGVGARSFAHNFIDTTTNQNAFTSGTSFKITELTELTNSNDSNASNTVFKYDYSKTTWTVYDKKNNYSTIATSTSTAGNANLTAEFNMGTTDSEFESYDYDVNFNNTLKTGSLTLSKLWKANQTAPTDGEYSFTVLIDLDGTGTECASTAYKLAGKLNDKDVTTDSDGKITLKSGESVTFNGIPVGASYTITENIPGNAAYQSDKTGNTVSGTITENPSTAQVTFTNENKSKTVNKVIYIETVKDLETDPGTNYVVKDPVDQTTIDVNTFTAPEGITTSVTNETEFNFKTTNPNQKYEVGYSGKKTDGTIVTGTITVYTYKATDKVYVFDYGLESNLAATNTNNDGLFQDGTFYNSNASGNDATTAELNESITPLTEDGAQTQITVEKDSSKDSPLSISNDGEFASEVMFKPIDYMSQIEKYTYTANITKTDATFDSANPETGTVVNGSIKVMPASTVYYEDNFGTKVTYTGNYQTNNQSTALPEQSNDQSEQYGHDDAYDDSTDFSAGGSAVMYQGSTATFTFTGTGFDIISRTNQNTGTILVKVESNGTTIKTIPLITYYDDGDIYQVPVIHEVDYAYGTYTVTIEVQEFDSSDETICFYLDGIRIYEPLEDDEGAYLDSESLATDQEIRPLILGSTVAGEGDGIILCKYEKVTSGNVTMSGLEGGNTYVETLGTNCKNPASTNSLDDYWKFGPNNELYLEPGNAIAFLINKKDYDDYDTAKTLQVAAKVEEGSSVSLRAVDAAGTEYSLTTTKAGEQVKVDTISTTSTMYYNVPVNEKMVVTNNDTQYYQIIIANTSSNNGRVSLTNLKYTVTPEVPSEEPSRAKVRSAVASVYGTDDGTVNSAKFSGKVLKGKTATIQVYTSLDVEGVNVFDSDGNLLELEWTTSTKTMNNNTKLKFWKAKFTAPSTAGKYTYKVTGQIGAKETFDVGEAVLTVK